MRYSLIIKGCDKISISFLGGISALLDVGRILYLQLLKLIDID